MNAALDAEITAEFEGGAAFKDTNGSEASAGRTQRFGGFISPDAPPSSPYLELVDNPRVRNHLDAMFSSPRIAPGSDDACSFRLDHMYLDLIQPPDGSSETTAGPIGTTLHKIGLPDAFYINEDGAMYNGLLTVAYNLTDVDPALGGFACIPGSHKSALPSYFRSASWKTLSEASMMPEDVRRIGGAAGSAIIFTEALAHGTLPWRAGHQRRTVFAKFNAHSMSFSSGFFDMSDYAGDLTQREWQILMPPSARTDLGGLQNALRLRQEQRQRQEQDDDDEQALEAAAAVAGDSAAAGGETTPSDEQPQQQQEEWREQEDTLPAPRPAESGRLEAGTRVELHSLVKSPALNGQSGTVTGYADASSSSSSSSSNAKGERVVVSLMSFDGRETKVAVQETNLKVLAPAPNVDTRFSPTAAAAKKAKL